MEIGDRATGNIINTVCFSSRLVIYNNILFEPHIGRTNHKNSEKRFAYSGLYKNRKYRSIRIDRGNKDYIFKEY